MSKAILKYILFALSITFSFLNCTSQVLHISFKDGTMKDFYLHQIKKISYNGDLKVLELQNGISYSWNVSSVDYCAYDGIIGIPKEESRFSSDFFQIYPNPSIDAIHLSFKLRKKSEVRLLVHNVQGQLVEVMDLGKIDPGNHERIIDLMGLDSGSYYVSIEIDKVLTSKKLIIGGLR